LWQLNSVKSSQAVSPVRCLYETNLMMGTEMVLKTSVLFRHLMQLITWEDFTEYTEPSFCI